MPKRQDIDSVFIIGAGPIVIGQACEFDYSGTQACKALKEEGYRVILINSNPATIMTDPKTADATYIEPINKDTISHILKIERAAHPEEKMVLLPTMGGQTALNTAMQLESSGILQELSIEMIGAKAEVIDKAEDRELFKNAMKKIGLETPKAVMVKSFEEAQSAQEDMGYPLIIRPSFTLGGRGGGIAYNDHEFEKIIHYGLAESPVGTVLVEESVLGWKEFEMEVVRDQKDNAIIICSIENIDPMGVHTGDSITVAPALTLTDKEYQYMRDASLAVLREIGVETGGSNVQFAINPDNGRMVVIEMNPRVSRSSALASKATGFPIAKIAAKLAIGYHLDELVNDITQTTPASFEPTIDYIVTKIPRFAFEKFSQSNTTLTTSMHSVGEAMAIGRNFAESFQKALNSMETGITGLDKMHVHDDMLYQNIITPTPDRILYVAEALRRGWDCEKIYQACKIDRWFLQQIEKIIFLENEIIASNIIEDEELLIRAKRNGFSDKKCAELANKNEKDIVAARTKNGIFPLYKHIDTCAAEFQSQTSYLYSSYEQTIFQKGEDEVDISTRNKVAIIGGGPNRIGQGIEFDYCCVHACYALQEMGYEAIMINCNPETVSTDYDTSDRLYFEPLNEEYVLNILKKEQEKGNLHGVIVQFGGQTPLKIARAIENANIPILGTQPAEIDLAEDRELFQQLLKKNNLKQPRNAIAYSKEDAIREASNIGYPVVLRPSFVLGGRAMEIIHDQESLEHYIDFAVQASGENPVLVDYYLSNAIEVDVDIIADGEKIIVAAIMEHIEEAGVHSGDSACSLPHYSLPDHIVDEIEKQSMLLAKALHVVGLMNIQFAVKGEDIYVLEANPRAARTVPFVAKAIDSPIASIAAKVMAGEKLSSFSIHSYRQQKNIAIKESVFPFDRFPDCDVILGPEMRSTGEVMGIASDFGVAFYKAQLAANIQLPKKGCVFVSVKDQDKTSKLVKACETLHSLGYTIISSHGTYHYLKEHHIHVQLINKVLEGRPHIVDSIINGEIALIFNTTEGKQSLKDSASIRQTAVKKHIPYYTTFSGILATTQALYALHHKKVEPLSIQSYINT